MTAQLDPSRTLPGGPPNRLEVVEDVAVIPDDETVCQVGVIDDNQLSCQDDGERDPRDQWPIMAGYARRSWIFRIFDFVGRAVESLFGLASLCVLLAIIATIPVAQFLSLGYLLDVQGRIVRGRSRFSRGQFGLMGLAPAARLGSLMLGTWLSLLPIRFLSGFWYQASLVDPDGSQTQILRLAHIVATGIILVNILAAWFCGGRLRTFFWPFVAPVSLAIWAARRIFAARQLRPLLHFLLDWISPSLVDDIANVPKIADWFLPAILAKSIVSGNLLSQARDGVWDFIQQWRPGYLFWLGLRGFFGAVLWLFLPTLFLVSATIATDGAAVVSGLFGVLLTTGVYLVLPFLQVQFARTNRLVQTFNLLEVYRAFRNAPVRHGIALFGSLILALPLFLLKIEQIPVDLVWLLSLVFVVFSLPARMLVAWAVAVGRRREKASWRLVRYPVLLMSPAIPLMFTGIFFFTRYTSWNGVWSLFEHHAFLLPVPFWIGPLVEGF